jgi:ketosteroid isomerase-like protein
MMLPSQPDIECSQAIQAKLEANFRENPATIKHPPLETQVAGNWAYELCNLAVTVTPKSGKPTEESVKYLVILKRQPDGPWKVYRDISNSNLKQTT